MTCPTSLRDVEPGIQAPALSREGDSTEVADEPPFEPVIVARRRPAAQAAS